MKTKCRRAATLAVERLGGMIVDWRTDAKHDVVVVDVGGLVIDIGFNNSENDEVLIRHVIKSRIRAATREPQNGKP